MGVYCTRARRSMNAVVQARSCSSLDCASPVSLCKLRHWLCVEGERCIPSEGSAAARPRLLILVDRIDKIL